MNRLLTLSLIALGIVVGACGEGGSRPPSAKATPTASSATATTTASMAGPPFDCPVSTATLVPPSNRLTGVTATAGTGFDRVTLEFGPGAVGGGAPPGLIVQAATPPFVEGASGRPLDVAGGRFVELTFRDMVVADEQGNPTNPGPTRLTLDTAAVLEVVQTEAFEGVVRWIIGTVAPGCARVAVDPTGDRIHVDVRRP